MSREISTAWIEGVLAEIRDHALGIAVGSTPVTDVGLISYRAEQARLKLWRARLEAARDRANRLRIAGLRVPRILLRLARGWLG